MSSRIRTGATAVAVAALCVVVWAQETRTAAVQSPASGVAIDADDIGGVVTSSAGPEAGVWVIAETTSLPTRLRKIVVTDGQGRYVLPDLPKATYRIWVRGYGLVDSQAVSAAPGRQLNLTAVVAPNPRAAAEVYPANYWYSLITVPTNREFPGTGPQGNGIGTEMTTRAQWIDNMKVGCELCHQMGTKATREIPSSLGVFDSSAAAWIHRTSVGQDGAGMRTRFQQFGPRGIAMFADWSDRIAAGEVPPAPPRPQGVERNVVVTQWEWGTPTSFIHDEITTDKRKPTVNANGPVFGLDQTGDAILIVDPIKNTASSVPVPVLDPQTPHIKPQQMPAPSPYWAEELVWGGRAGPTNPMLDGKGRLWFTLQLRPADKQPAVCKSGSTNKFAQYLPIEASGKHLAIYDSKTGRITPIDTCFRTMHLNFTEDKDDTLYFTNPDAATAAGWIKTRIFDETQDAIASQGWCPFVIDYNGDGTIGEYTDLDESSNPRLDRRVPNGTYGVAPNPVDGSVWYASPGQGVVGGRGLPGRIIRLEVGSNPPQTCKAEVYEPPFKTTGASVADGYTPRGIDVDRHGVVWTGLAGGGQLASFDRRKCKVLNGPTATGQHCPEGWTLYPVPGPRFKDTDIPVDHQYLNWTDQWNTLGLGANVPMTNGSGSDSLLALQPNGQWVVLRVPYPLGFYTRYMDGRIDDPNAGWKGRGVWANYGPNNLWHTEGGKGRLSAAVKFQVRPTPLDK